MRVSIKLSENRHKNGGLTCFEQILAINEEVETVVLGQVDALSDDEVELVRA